jgi:RNA polymerase sigma-70 factor (ECF subfamily)
LRIYAAQRLSLSTPEAEDVVQLAFTRFAATYDEKPIENVRAFLYRAVHNAAIDHIRRTQVRETYAQTVQSVEGREEDRAGPERSAISKQLLDIITGALWSMPSKRRKLLLMNRIEGLSYAEIARREQLSETVVRKHVAKALLGCQGALRQHGEEV